MSPPTLEYLRNINLDKGGKVVLMENSSMKTKTSTFKLNALNGCGGNFGGKLQRKWRPSRKKLLEDILLPAICYYNHISSSQQEMASALHFIVVLCGLWIGADVISAHQSDGCCSNGWTKFGSRCFKVFNTPKEWADAERFCTLHGANLASILTKEEGTFIGKMIKASAWVGGYDETKEGVWLWSDGKEFDFNQWVGGEPNNANGGEGCMVFFPQGAANDRQCNVPFDFICAKDA